MAAGTPAPMGAPQLMAATLGYPAPAAPKPRAGPVGSTLPGTRIHLPHRIPTIRVLVVTALMAPLVQAAPGEPETFLVPKIRPPIPPRNARVECLPRPRAVALAAAGVAGTSAGVLAPAAVAHSEAEAAPVAAEQVAVPSPQRPSPLRP